MSQHIRIGNTYWHEGEEREVITTHHDDHNDIWYRGVKSKDNGGVISTTDWVRQQPYDTFLGAVRMRDYPDEEEWQRMRKAVLERENYQCTCGNELDDSAPIHHIVPLGCGGTNTYRNLLPLCERCHGKVHSGNI